MHHKVYRPHLLQSLPKLFNILLKYCLSYLLFAWPLSWLDWVDGINGRWNVWNSKYWADVISDQSWSNRMCRWNNHRFSTDALHWIAKQSPCYRVISDACEQAFKYDRWFIDVPLVYIKCVLSYRGTPWRNIIYHKIKQTDRHISNTFINAYMKIKKVLVIKIL